MAKFLYIYYNTGDDKSSADDWKNWFGQLGDKLMDPGNPFNGGKAVSKEGVMDVKDMPATGYSIVSAKNMDEALETAKGCPLVSYKGGAVCVYEALPM
ncbi:hypothetical protein KW792_00170 [Candidatus Saccharibacteria bacterium]|nr:hypothetical protein [Candidatus Saccharibacteria bacterium]